MKYSRSLLLYQDEPSYGLLLRLIVSIVPVTSLVGSIYLASSGESIGAIVLLVEALLVGLIFWSVFPRRYQVYEDHLRIVLGGPFSVKVGFDNIKTIEVTSRLSLSVNFITKLTNSYVIINKRKGFSIAITPRDYDSFVEYSNDALSMWVKASANEL